MKGSTIVAATALLVGLVGGKALGHQEGHAEGLRDGRVSAFYDVSMDGYMVYLGCLATDCSREKAISDYMVGRADDWLKAEGVEQ